MRFSLKSGAYEHWGIRPSDYPDSGTTEQKIQFLLGFAVLAPSTFNSQPWQCRIDGSKIEVLIRKDRMPQESDKNGRFGVISVGCFVENLVIAATYYGWETKVSWDAKPFDKSSQMATIELKENPQSKPGKEAKTLFEAIPNRATNRSHSQVFKLQKSEIEELTRISSASYKINLLDAHYRDQLIEISGAADMEIWSDINFRKEHLQWVRNNLTRQPDGMPAFGVGIGLIPSFMASPMILSPVFARIQASKNKSSLISSNYFIVISGKDGKMQWGEVGQLFQRLGLLATSLGYSLAPMGQFIESQPARQKLHKLIRTNHPPQMFLRLNKPSRAVKHSPRRGVGDIMDSTK